MNHYENKKEYMLPRPAIIQLLILLLFLLAGAILSSIISTGLLLATHGLQADITQDANLMRLIQFISAICTFLLPSIAMAWICSDNPRHYLISQENHRRQDLDSHLSLRVLIFSGYQFARIAQQADGVTRVYGSYRGMDAGARNPRRTTDDDPVIQR